MIKNNSPYHKLLNTASWRRLRGAVLSEYPFCVDCLRHGITTPATEVHHIRPVESIKDPDRMRAMTYDRSNCVSLCHDCHVERHRVLRSHSRREIRKRASDEASEFARRFFSAPGGEKKERGEGS